MRKVGWVGIGFLIPDSNKPLYGKLDLLNTGIIKWKVEERIEVGWMKKVVGSPCTLR